MISQQAVASNTLIYKVVSERLKPSITYGYELMNCGNGNVFRQDRPYAADFRAVLETSAEVFVLSKP